MIQFNLLPDIKLEYIKAERLRQAVILASVFISVGALLLFGIFFATNYFAKRHLASTNVRVTSEVNQLKGNSQIDKILTIQNQLTSLTTLHDAKPVVTRLFTYLNQVTPDKVIGISNMSVDYTKSSINVTGTADSLGSVNKFVDTLKFTKYAVKGSDPIKAFSNVVLTMFSYTTPSTASGPQQPGDAAATYTLDFNYDPAIFNVKESSDKLDVPSKITTRSEVDKPSDLFVPAPKSTGGTR